MAAFAMTGAAASIGLLAVGGDTSPHDMAEVAKVSSPAPPLADPAVVAAMSDRSAAVRQTNGPAVSRGGNRPALRATQPATRSTQPATTKASALPVSRQDVSGAVTETVAPTDPRDVAKAMLADYGWSPDQFSCLDALYMHESGWNPSASNPSSGAYGLPQALPGDKMAAYGADWQTNPATQLKWGLSYIRERYGSPCGAWGFWESNNWY